MTILFSITTCLHLPGKLKQTRECLKLLFTVERNWAFVDSFILVNEYNPDNPDGADTSWIRSEYPLFKIIQKGPEKQGQAHSVNIILDALKDTDATYWLHWEESWMIREPFLLDAMHIMHTCPDVTQLQIAKGWYDVPHEQRDGYLMISPEYHAVVDKTLGSDAVSCKWKGKPWPLFSLQPGIDRVEKIIHVGYFNPQHNSAPRGKVNGSEFHFSHRWYLQGVRKAVLTPFRAIRDAKHHSTSFLL